MTASMNKRRLACSLALVLVFISCVTGENDVPPGCKIQRDGKKLQCCEGGLNRIPKTIPEGVTIANFRDNNITHIGVKDSQTILGLRKVYLAKNPFHCDCNLNHLRELLVRKQFTALQDGARIQCASPPHVQNQTLISLSYSQLCEFKKCELICDKDVKCIDESHCACKSGFRSVESKTETRCENIDECTINNNCPSSPAINYCKDTNGSFECVCNKGYEQTPDKKYCTGSTAKNSQIPSFHTKSKELNDNCKLICKNDAKCINESHCACKSGFRYQKHESEEQCLDINECLDTNICPISEVAIIGCKDTGGTYECVCNAGFEHTPDKKNCIDIDECKTTADCSKFGKKCHNTIGSHVCMCDPGFRYSIDRKKCMDDDECKSRKNNCSHHSYCKNTHGGFTCVCPKNYELSNFKCIPNDITRWITPKYLLQDIKDGVWSRILAILAAFVILLSLCVLGVVGIRKMRGKCAERREMKRLAYEEQLMFAAGLIDPDHLFLEGEMGYQGDEMFYPGDMGYLPDGMGYPPDGMGYPPEGMGYPPEGMGYPPDGMGYPPGGVMGYADDMEYNDEMGYSEENFDNVKPNISPMTTNENFDQMVPHTYYEDDQYEENSEGEGETY